MRPLLLLDVDGVLNAFGSLFSPEYEAERFEPITRNNCGHRIRIPKGTRERIAALVDVFDPVWATAWSEDAHPFFAEPLALGEPWPVVDLSTGTLHPGRSWKWRSVETYLDATDRSAAWVDDDLSEEDFDWARDRCSLGLPTLLVRTDAHVGLTDRHLMHLLIWAGAHTTEATS
jgi:HAD domain in Swiss Army Knife RNA repair proteins